MDKLAQLRGPSGDEVKGDVATFEGFNWIFNNLISVVLGFAAIILFLMLILGGFKYITSGGNPEKAAGAKATLTYAILGMVMLILSILALRIISDITGAQILDFTVYQGG